MARGRKTSLMIRLTPEERRTLQAWQRATTIAAGRARRGRIIVLVADGLPISAVATTVGISRRFVYKWVQRFLEKGMEGLTDKPGRGRVLRQPALAGQHDVSACGDDADVKAHGRGEQNGEPLDHWHLDMRASRR